MRKHKITQISTRKALFFSFLVILELGLALALAAEATAATPATVSIGNFTSAPGETVTAPILISNVENYGTGTISVTYDPAVVHVASVSSGPDSTAVAWNINNTTGIVTISAWNIGGVSGDIVFANVTFKAVRTGSTPLNISVTTLKDISLQDITAIIKNGSFTIEAEQFLIPFLISGHVFYENGSECNNPHMKITNMNTSEEWQAEAHINENFYQITLNGGADVDATEVLQFEVTSPAHSQSNITFHTVTLEEINQGGLYNFNFTLKTASFDTGPSTYPYPSISGVHHGNFTPKRNIIVHQIFTYPCAGTGGHSEYVVFCDYETGERKIEVRWNGYQGDYHNITVSPPVELLKNRVYNYTIITGSYPQIIHRPSYENDYGIITCTKFTDINGREYNDWIPAIRLSP